MTEGIRTAVLYARVSTDEQATSGYSLRQQIEALRAWCGREGYEVAEEVTDPGHSGAYLERPGLDRMRDLVAAGGVSVVVAQDRDRFAREPAYFYLLKREFAEHGTKMRALNDRGDESPEGELTDGILDQLAKFERAKIAERTRRGLNKKVTEGKLVRGPRAPYGFAYDEHGEALAASEPEMGTVRAIFRMVGAEGGTLGGIVKSLEGEGVPSPTGGNWHRPTLRYVILNELYRPRTVEEIAASGLVTPAVVRALDPEKVYGLWCWNKRRQERWRERAEDGGYKDRYRMVPRPREEWSGVPVDLSDAGLSRELVDLARERISDNRRRPPSTVARRFWQLSGGIARCAECGSSLTPQWAARRTGGYRFYYNCRQRYSNGPRDCTNTRTPRAEPLEEAVWKAVRAMLSDPERVLRGYDEYVERRKAQLRGDPGREAREIAGRLEKLERRRSGYLDLAADGDMSREELRRKLAEVDERREAARKTLREARDREETIRKLRRDRETMLGRFSAMRGMDLRHLDPENRRRVLQALRLRVEVDKNGDARISGVFDADNNITELLPMAQAPADEPYTVRFHHEIPPPFKGVVTLDNTRIAGCSPSRTTS
jgi:site-specific DNA recombinase